MLEHRLTELDTGEAVLLQEMFATVEQDNADSVEHNLLEVETKIEVVLFQYKGLPEVEKDMAVEILSRGRNSSTRGLWAQLGTGGG